MGSNQQTAVEWLWDKLLEETETGELRYHLKHDIVKVFEQAFTIEREQIETAYKSDRRPCSDEDAQEYYNDTYGK